MNSNEARLRSSEGYVYFNVNTGVVTKIDSEPNAHIAQIFLVDIEPLQELEGYCLKEYQETDILFAGYWFLDNGKQVFEPRCQEHIDECKRCTAENDEYEKS